MALFPLPPPPVPDPLSVEVGIDGDPADTAPGPELTPGSAFEFTYAITNTGDETLWALYLWHDGLGGVDIGRRVDSLIHSLVRSNSIYLSVSPNIFEP